MSIFKVNGQSLCMMSRRAQRMSVNIMLTKSVNTAVNMLTLSARVSPILLNLKNKEEVINNKKIYLSALFNLIA